MVIQRGDVWWADLPTPTGSGPGYGRPVLIVQSDPFNQSALNTVTVAVITGNLELTAAPGNVFLSARVSGLLKDSVVNVSQVLTIDRTLLMEYVNTLSFRKIAQINRGLRLALGL